MTITRITALFLALLLVLTGCSGSGGDATTADSATALGTTTAAKADEPLGELTVYLLDTGTTSQKGYIAEAMEFAGRNREYTIEIEEFNDEEAMEERLKIELTAGQGPDVILSDMLLSLDMMELAGNGTLYDMTDIIAADTSFTAENYYMSVMKAGQIEDRQYVIPLSFTLPAFISSDTALEDAGIDWDDSSTLEVYEQMLHFLKSDDTEKISGWGGWLETGLTLLSSCGKTPVSYDTGEVLIDGKDERMVLELGTEIFKQGNSWIGDNMALNTGGFVKELAKLPLIYTNLNTSPNQLRLYYSAYAAVDKGDEFRMYFAPDEEGNHHALVQEFAAVTRNVENPELAWQLIRFVIDHEQSFELFAGVSLNRKVTAAHLENLSAYKGKNLGDFQVEKMPETYTNQLADAYDRITDATVQQFSPVHAAVRDGMISCIRNEVDFDSMIDEIVNKLTLYVNE